MSEKIEKKESPPLPFKAWWPLAAGVLSGIAMRLVFSGRPGSAFAAMLGSFIYLSPVVVGAVTVYVAERRGRRTWAYYFWAPFLANVLYVAGTLMIMIEGLICALLIVPMFALVGGLAGLLMGAVCRITKWPRQMLMGLGVLPLALAPLEAQLPIPDRLGTIERSVLVDAAPFEIWQGILNTGGIDPSELERAWIFRIGVPLPLGGATEQTPAGFVRHVAMTRHVRFDELITDWQPPTYVRWIYRFEEDSFPPGALDDHVRVGGHYFDLVDTSYALTQVGTRTELKVRMSYRVSTPFNWYAVPLARALIGNMAQVNVEYYAKRAMHAKGGAK